MREKIDEVLGFWFGEIENGFPKTDRESLWWQGGEALDVEIQHLFGSQVSQALNRNLDAWLETPRGRLALVILLDQFTRNIYRGTADAFAGDPIALSMVKDGLDMGHDIALEPVERLFFYMPLEHSENIDDQNLCIENLEKVRAEVGQGYRAKVDSAIDFAVLHRDVIAQFGRFPHRNQVLGRKSTDKELAYLNQSHSSWGQ